jgi:TetR/AcrR family transcriptional repressor of nem operon
VRRPTSREAAKQATRGALVLAGKKLFAKKGLDAPSLDAICEQAGYTRGAFYVHFKDRDDLLAAVMEEVGRDYLDGLFGVQDEDRADIFSIAQRFVDTVASGAYPLAQKGGVRPHQLLDACARNPKVRRKYVDLVEETVQRIRQSVGAAQTGGLVRDDVDAERLATALMLVVLGAQTMIDLGARFDAGATTAAVLSLLGPAPKRTWNKKR